MKSGNWIWIILSVACVGAVLMLLTDRYPGRLDGMEDRTRVITLIGMLILVGGGCLARFRARPGTNLAQVGLWVLIFAGLMLGYSFKDEFGWIGVRLSGELTPSAGGVEGSGEISFPLAADDHYHVMATINGKRVEFLVDSGASDIVLSPADARRLGYNSSELSFTSMAETANGSVMGAPIRIDEIAVGPIVMLDIPAQVNQAEMSDSLLGMEFLNRLKSWHVEDGRLTLRK